MWFYFFNFGALSMKRIHYLLLALITISLNSCFAVVGSAIRLGFKMGVYSVLILIGLLIWVIIKRGKKR
jgi:hypothetical protein